MAEKFADRILLALAPPFAACLIHLLAASMRLEYVGGDKPAQFWERGENVIFSFWHEQLLLMAKSTKADARVLISASKDGELIARTIHHFGLGTIRGSSTRGGDKAFRALLKEARQKVDLVVTPDGPKGPRHQVKDGVVQLARLTRRPVLPLAFVCSRGKRFNSWDRFLMPYPFSRGLFLFGEPVQWQLDEDIDHFKKRIQQAMDETNLRAKALLEENGVSAV